ncbi:MAG: NADH-quinone oxidoreductase subunit N [Planctomycetes bacterium]|nr:NADH-quinone oxidoreductase subunit N [Planctomycetota bacterium]
MNTPSLLAESFWVPSGRELFLFSPELVLVGTIVALLVVPLIWRRNAYTTASIALVGVVMMGIMALLVAREVSGGGQSGLSPSPLSGMLIADSLSVFFKLILALFFTLVVALWWMGSGRTERDAPEFFTLLLGSALGMALMVSTQNMLMMVIAIELASLPSYAIVAFDKRNRLAAEASLKYVIFGSVSAAIMLYGASLLYGLYGSLEFSVIGAGVYESLLAGTDRAIMGAALVCLFSGIAFKISAVPFHFWCPDVFQGARIEVTTWLSVASKAAGLLLLLRLVQVFCNQAIGDPMTVFYPLAWFIGIVAAVTCTWGNFAAYKQTSVKRLLAYSSIAHAGFMLMAVAIFAKPDATGGAMGGSAISAVLLYLLVYVFMNLGAFGVTAMVVWATGSDSISSFTGLVRRSPGLAIPMVCCLISLVGLPPFAGFLGKYWVLAALFEHKDASSHLFVLLAVVGVFNTLFSLYYYMRVIVQMTLRDDDQPAFSSPLGGVVIVNLCAVVLLGMLIFAGPLKAGTDRYAANLFTTPVAVADAHASSDR